MPIHISLKDQLSMALSSKHEMCSVTIPGEMVQDNEIFVWIWVFAPDMSPVVLIPSSFKNKSYASSKP